MISLKGKKVVDLTAELVARVARMDGTIELGSPDVYGHGWLCEETINNKDGTIEHLVGSDAIRGCWLEKFRLVRYLP